MAMYIKNDDLEFLNKIYKDLKEVADDDDADRLLDLIQRLQEQRYREDKKRQMLFVRKEPKILSMEEVSLKLKECVNNL